MSDPQTQQRTLRSQARAGQVRVTLHGHEEMMAEDIALGEVLEALGSAVVLEDYPEHRRGPCCLVLGYTKRGRPLHVVCTSSLPALVVITVYEPQPPKWATPTQRRG